MVLVFVRLVNMALCQISMQVEMVDAYESYTECLRTAQGTAGDHGCYNELALAIGESSLEFVSCLF